MAEATGHDAWIRRQNADRTAVRQPDAFPATMTTRMALNEARSALGQRATYVDLGSPSP